MAKISVVIPVFDAEMYIERCARSLFGQTLDDIEYLFVDDCSPDNSIDVLKRVLEDFPERKKQVIIHRMNENSGQAAVRTWGMQNASGDYVIHCDSDDWVDLDLFGRMYDNAVRFNFDIVVCDCANTDGFRTSITYGGHKTSAYDCVCDMLYRKMMWSLCNKLVKRDLYINSIVYPSGNMGEDMCFCLQMTQKAQSIGYVKGSYYYYYQNPSSIVHLQSEDKCIQKQQQLSDNIKILERAFGTSDARINKGLDYLNFYAQEMLVPAIGNSEIYKKWWNGVSPYLWRVFFDRCVMPKQRLKALLISLRIYPHRPKNH